MSSSPSPFSPVAAWALTLGREVWKPAKHGQLQVPLVWAGGRRVRRGDVLFPDGFDQITTNLVHGLDIHLSTEVTEIAPGQVRLADGNRIAADRIVCSLPLGVLRSGRVRFAAPLARNRQAAIDGLRFDRIA